MSHLRARPLAALVALLSLSSPVLAQDDIPLRNWAVPAQARGHLSTLSDIGGAVVFVSVAPCRIVDTRGGAPLGGGVGPFTSGQTRNYDLNSAGAPCTGIPAGTTGYSVNVTVTNDSGTGYVAIYPTGNPPSPMVSLLNYTTASAVANATIVPCDSSGSVTVLNQGGTADIIVDINGYFTNPLNTGEQLWISTTMDGAAAIVGYNWSNVDGSHGVGGYAGGTGVVHGVQGQIGATAGVYASGVHGIATDRDKSFAVLGDVSGYAGGTYFGSGGGAGVMGRGTRLGVSGYANPPATGGQSAGTNGVVLTSGSYVVDVAGTLGIKWQATGEKYGVYYSGGLGGFGTKSFLEPHPTDPERIVRYYALEGPESGTYCRGSAATKDGVAVLDLPDTFRWVSDAEGITVQLTPTGSDFVQMRVERKDLDRVVVRSSKDTTFDWLVQGIRRAYKDAEVTPRSEALRPEGPGATIPAFLSPEERRRVISSGLYNPDGTVNMRTAERLGWTREWEARAEEPQRP